METKRHTPSVIAKLMGLDELPPQQPIHRPKRVLSENYLRKTASIGLYKKRTTKDGQSFGRNSEKQQEVQKVQKEFAVDSAGDLGSDYLLNLLKLQSGMKNEASYFPTRIVVLKPNSENAKGAYESSFLLNSQSCDMKQKFSSPKIWELYSKVDEMESPKNDLEPSRHGFRVSRESEKGKKTSRKTRDSIASWSSNSSYLEVRLDGTCINERAVGMLPSASFLNQKNQNQTPYSSSNGSIFAMEARKKLSLSWKMAKVSQEVGTGSLDRTLSEMLSMPTLEANPRTRNHKLYKHGLRSQFSPSTGDSKFCSPLGINSKEGWKDELVTNLPISKLFHRKQNFSMEDNSKSNHARFSSVKLQHGNDIDFSDDHTTQETEVILDEPENKLEVEHVSEVNLVERELSTCKTPCSDMDNDHKTSQGIRVIQDEAENNLEKLDMSRNSGCSSVVPNSSRPASATSDAVVVADAGIEDLLFSSGDTTNQQSEPIACNDFLKDEHSSDYWDSSTVQDSPNRSPKCELIYSNCMGIDAECLMSLGEAYQPSPDSVLEAPFKEDNLSGSECCGTVSNNLHGLWMQLQLLKSESEETYSGRRGMAVSSDEDNTEKSFDCSAKNAKLIKFLGAKECRDFSYLADVLEELGFHDGNVEIIFERWHSPEWPMSFSVFETLEKKYGEQISWNKAERRLLFDRINAGFMEILRPCIDIHICSKPLRKKISTALRRDVIEEELWKLLVSQENEVSLELSAKAVGTERWLELADDIDTIAREIENFLFDELSAELVSI